MYYKVDFNSKESPKAFTDLGAEVKFHAFFNVDTEEELNRLIQENIDDMSRRHNMEYTATVTELTEKEYIDVRENDMRVYIKQGYRKHLGDDKKVPAREFFKLMNDPTEYVKAIQYFVSKTNTQTIIDRIADLDKMTVSQYNSYVERLMTCSVGDEFESIVAEIKREFPVK